MKRLTLFDDGHVKSLNIDGFDKLCSVFLQSSETVPNTFMNLASIKQQRKRRSILDDGFQYRELWTIRDVAFLKNLTDSLPS